GRLRLWLVRPRDSSDQQLPGGGSSADHLARVLAAARADEQLRRRGLVERFVQLHGGIVQLEADFPQQFAEHDVTPRDLGLELYDSAPRQVANRIDQQGLA